MADIVLTIPNNQIARATDALCAVGNYADDPDDANARREFARGVLRDYLRRVVLDFERQQAMSAAMASVSIDAITVT